MTSTFVGAGTLVLGAALCLAWAPPPARAQDANRDAVYAKTDVAYIVVRVQRRTGAFKEDFNKAVAHSILDSSKMEEKAKHRADDLHDASKKLKDVFGEKKDKNDSKVREQVDNPQVEQILGAPQAPRGPAQGVVRRRQFTGAIRTQTPEEIARALAKQGLPGLEGTPPTSDGSS